MKTLRHRRLFYKEECLLCTSKGKACPGCEGGRFVPEAEYRLLRRALKAVCRRYQLMNLPLATCYAESMENADETACIARAWLRRKRA